MAKVLLITLFKGQKNYQVGPPLGLLYLAAVLRDAGYEVRLLDLRARKEPISAHAETIAHFAPDVIGLSAVIPEANVLRLAAPQLKRLAPRAKIVVGGPYANSSTWEALGVPDIDAVVRGEGELVLPRLLAAWAAGEAQPELPGVGYPGVGLGPPPQAIEDLDALPFPAWELAEFDTYHHQPRHGYLYAHRRYFSVLSSRGCPYHCIFCQALFGHRFRARSPKSVVDALAVVATSMSDPCQPTAKAATKPAPMSVALTPTPTARTRLTIRRKRCGLIVQTPIRGRWSRDPRPRAPAGISVEPRGWTPG